MAEDEVTLDATTGPLESNPLCEPGAVVVYSSGAPCLEVVSLAHDSVTIGRNPNTAGRCLALKDSRLSRIHAEIRYHGGLWEIEDLGSRNGTQVDGRPISGRARFSSARVVSLGGTIIVLESDIGPLAGERVEQIDGKVLGPRVRAVLERIRRIASFGDALAICGESGTGKELAAETFQRAARPRGPLVAVNCAAIPEGMAERLFFGTAKGAYSGATEAARGYLQAADGGVLFLDEIAELDLEIQAKLLRALENREVMPLGSTTPGRVDLLVCSATQRPLAEAVQHGRFREDLFYRLAQREVHLPPLRSRPEDIPYLVVRELAALGPELCAHPSLIEACLLRSWRGNIRALRAAVRHAGDEALSRQSQEVRGEWLPEAHAAPAEETRRPARIASRPLTREEIEGVLAKTGGNVSEAARALSLHRTQLYRIMTTLGMRETR